MSRGGVVGEDGRVSTTPSPDGPPSPSGQTQGSASPTASQDAPARPARRAHGGGNWRSLVLSMLVVLAVVLAWLSLMPRPARIERPTVDGGTVIEDDFEDLVPPTTFMLGVGYDVFRSAEHDLTVSGQLTNPNDNAEQFNVGAEYVWNDLLALRAGYEFGLEEATAPSVGVGLHVPGLGPDLRVDYGFNQLDRLGSIHRIVLNLRLN